VEQPSPFGRVLLVTGPEGLLAERAVADWVRAALAERPAAGVNRLQAAELDAGALTEAAGGSLFAEASVLVLNDVAELPADLADRLVAIATDPGPDLALAIVHAGGAKGKAVLDRLKKLRPQIVDCPPVKAWEPPQFVVAEVRRAGGKVDLNSAAALVDAIGSDTRALAGAARQLLDDSADRLITEASIRRYFGGRAEVTSFAVAEDALGGRADGALGKLRWALVTGVAPVLVTSAFSSNLRSLGRYLDSRGSRMSDADLARSIGIPPWKLKDIARQARSWEPRGVAGAIQAVALADAQIKGAVSDPGFALEQLVLKVIACRGRGN